MTDIERRALLGDKQAQEECTRQGIVLPCHVCGHKALPKNNGIHERGHNAPSSCADYYTVWTVCCSYCRNKSLEYTTDFYFSLNAGEICISGDDGREKAIRNWNFRPCLPIGKCKDCANWRGKPGDEYAPCKDCDGVMEADNFCKNFEQREEKGNG